MYRDKMEHKYLVIHIMLAMIMYSDLLYFYSSLLNPKNIRYLITFTEVSGKAHLVGAV